jgi:hypothetical protein
LISSCIVANVFVAAVKFFERSLPRNSRLYILVADSIQVTEPTTPPIPWVQGAVSLGVKRSGREAYHSPSFIAGANNGGMKLKLSEVK